MTKVRHEKTKNFRKLAFQMKVIQFPPHQVLSCPGCLSVLLPPASLQSGYVTIISQKGPSSIMELTSIKKLDPPGLEILLRTGVMLLLFLITNDAQLKINRPIHLLTMMMIHLDPLHRPVLAIPRETEVMLLLFLVKNDAQVKIICRIVLLTIMEMIHLHPLCTR